MFYLFIQASNTGYGNMIHKAGCTYIRLDMNSYRWFGPYHSVEEARDNALDITGKSARLCNVCKKRMASHGN